MKPRRRAYVVCDLGFGDAGKGLVTDALVRRTGAGLVVRYNGGAQAGHNVVTVDGRHHTFAQLGAGSFVPGVRTFLSRFVVVHPTALLHEAAHFDRQTGGDVLARVEVSEGARIITPFHQALNRLRELSRGEDRHGSCGVGVGETVRDTLEAPDDAVTAGDLRAPTTLRRKLSRIRERTWAQARMVLENRDGTSGHAGVGCREDAGIAVAMREELALFEIPEVPERWIAQLRPLVARGCIVDEAQLRRRCLEAGVVVFEGAQGVLLDEWIGFHPHTTWSDCTPRQAMNLLRALAPELEPVRVGVLRCHSVRHGPGPLPTESDVLRRHVEEHNGTNAWQGPVRYGWLDAVLARYALARSGGMDLLALTHLDLLERLGSLPVVSAYRTREEVPGSTWSAHWRPGAVGRELRAETPGSKEDGADEGALLAAQQALGEWLSKAVAPELTTIDAAALLVAWVERELGIPVALTSRGPTAAEVTFRDPFFEAEEVSDEFDPAESAPVETVVWRDEDVRRAASSRATSGKK